MERQPGFPQQNETQAEIHRKPRASNERLDALAEAAVDQWQPPLRSPNGDHSVNSSAWFNHQNAALSPRPTQNSHRQPPGRDLDPREAIQLITRIVTEKAGSNGKQKALTETILQALDAVVTSSSDDGLFNGSHTNEYRQNHAKNGVESAHLQSRLENLLSNVTGGDGDDPRRHQLDSRPPKTFGENDGERCPICQKRLPRNCELNKHMKRHTRPYGCTFPRCKKRFGSKNDWKRHENSQHFQQETYRCRVKKTIDDSECAQVFYCKDMFKSHLQNAHKYNEDECNEESRERHIGRNGQGRFWCGFCKDVIKLSRRGIEAWDERFQHIGEHFNRDQYQIKDWLCLESNKPKGQQVRELNRDIFDDQEQENKSNHVPRGIPTGSVPPGMSSAPMDGSDFSTGSKKRQRPDSAKMNGQYYNGARRSEVLVFCVRYSRAFCAVPMI
jgi:hypothetical protein